MYKLREICQTSIDGFRKLGHTIETRNGPLIHIDNGGDVLAVAHLDHVGKTKPKIKGDRIQCTQLDDRLGVWVLLELLPTLTNHKYDILLTDSEEIGRSTAQYFKGNYNWIFEFDRAGSDCVLYDYEDKETCNLIESFGWQVGDGAFSDICSLEHLGVKAFNFGTGYHLQHSPKCYANLSETIANVKRFVPFFEAMGGVKLPHEIWDRWEEPEHNYCADCGQGLETSWEFCPWCGLERGLTGVKTHYKYWN